jgi:hypothetical protein
MPAPRPNPGNNVPDILSNAFEFAKTFGQYELAPETLVGPNQRVRPGIMDGYAYTPQPGETVDDSGQWYTADMQPIEWVDRPQLASLLDLFGNTMGGVAAPVRAAAGEAVLGAGPILKARPSELLNMDPTAAEYLAQHVEAMRKRAPMGYKLGGEATLEKADNALTKLSLPPSKNAMGVVERAAELGFDTPMFHVSGYRAGEKPLKDGSVPFLTPDPNRAGRGAVFFGDMPSSIVRSGAAVGAGGGDGASVFPFLLRAPIMGEHAIPEEALSALPDSLQFASSAPDAFATPQSIQDLVAGIRNGPYRQEAMDARLAATPPGDRQWIKSQIEQTDESLAKHMARMYYAPEMGGGMLGPDDFMPVPGGKNQPGVPHYGLYEHGAVKSTGGQGGAPSFFQTGQLGLGFTGSRVADETAHWKNGKTIAMPYAPAIRSVNAKFDPRKVDESNVLSGAIPPGWFSSLFQQQQEEPQL